MGFTKVDGKWVSKDGDQAGLLEFMALNKRGGELFINDIHKLWRYNEIQWWIIEKEIKEAKEQNWLSWFPENQPVVFISSD